MNYALELQFNSVPEAPAVVLEAGRWRGRRKAMQAFLEIVRLVSSRIGWVSPEAFASLYLRVVGLLYLSGGQEETVDP